VAVTRGTLRLARQLRRAVGTEADQAVRSLTAEWVTAWDRLTPAWTAAAADLVAEAVRLGHWPRPTDIARTGSAIAALQATEDALTRLARSTATTSAAAASRAVDADLDLEARIIASQAPATEREALLAHTTGRGGLLTREQDRDTVNLTVLSRIRTFAPDVIRQRVQGQITSTANPLPAETLEVVRRELIRGVEVGDNPRTAAARIVAQAQAGFNGGLARALNIARTETLDAYRNTSQQIHAANADIVPGWQWLATLDTRVCSSCLAMHGQQFPTSQPGPWDHQQGRCARLPVLASWAELGITAPEPPGAIPDAEAWFASLPRAERLRIMGPARLDLLESGRVGWGDLATLRTSTRWRPSYVPTPVRDLRRRVAQGLPPTPRPAPIPRVHLATTTLPAPQPRLTPTQRVQAGDFSGLTRVGPQRGSNPGGLYEAADGSRWYIKSLPEGQAREEALAASLYRAAGVRVPEVRVGRGAPGLPGQTQVASRYIDDATRVRGAAAVADEMRDGFGVDAWLANWDVAGESWDNVVVSGGHVWRIDVGGSLRYRAQGGLKGAAFGDEVTEWITLRSTTRAPQASQAFRGMTPAQQLAAARRVQSVKPSTIRAMVREHGLDDDLATVLIRRRKSIVDRLPTLQEQAKRHAAWQQAAAQAREGQAALNAVQRSMARDRTVTPRPAEWTDSQFDAVGRSALRYRRSGYQPINSALRSRAALPEMPEHIRQHIENLDLLLGSSQLQDTVLGYRGVSNLGEFINGWNNVDVTGLTWTDWAYSSMSASRGIAEMFAGSGGESSVLMRIVARPGHPAFQLSDMDDEAEILLRRGATFRVVADYGIVNNRRILDVEIVT